MAGRPPKLGLDWAGWNVDLFDNDPKIDKLLSAQGCMGFTIYFFLCQKIYGSHGYYYSWSYADAPITASKLGGGASANSVEETVRYCLRISLFDERLFVEWNILTSRGIQKRYRQAALARTDKSIIAEYWLLNASETAGLFPHSLKPDSGPVILTQERKGEDRKGEENKGKESKEKIFLKSSPFLTEEESKGEETKRVPMPEQVKGFLNQLKNNLPVMPKKEG